MSTELAKTAIEALKFAPRYLPAVAAVCGVLVFSSNAALDSLGLREFTENNRHWIGLTFLLATAIAAVDGAKEIVGWVRNRVVTAKLKQKRLQRLHALTEAEKQILRHYIAKQTRTNTLRIQDGVVNGLEAAGIIDRASSLGDLHSGFSYNITEFAWEYLNKNQGLLLGTTNIVRSDAETW